MNTSQIPIFIRKRAYWKALFILICMLGINSMNAQQYSLKQLIDSAMVHYPLSQQNAILQKQKDLQIEKIKGQNLPQVNLAVNATYQNPVISLPINIPGINIPELDADQYKAQLEISQAIYKGGLTKIQKELAEQNAQIQNQQNEIELSKVKQQLIGIYYQIILNQRFIAIHESVKSSLEKRLEEINSAVKNGVILASTADALQAEILSNNQKLLEYQSQVNTLFKQLETLTSLTITPQSNLELPSFETNDNMVQSRPEFKLMEYNQNKINTIKSMQDVQIRPMAFAYGSFGYGKPGLDLFSNEFNPYMIMGVKLNWKLWSWNEHKKEKAILDLSQQIIENQKESFLTQLNTQLKSLRNEYIKEGALLEQADQIVVLRKKVSTTSAHQLNNGSITSSQYVADLTLLQKAQIEKEIHQIKQSIAQTNLLWALGRL